MTDAREKQQIVNYFLKKPVATYFLNSRPDISPAYEGRASLEVDVEKGESKLHLMKVTLEDSRKYQCSVMIPNDDEGTTLATTTLLVLVPPSPPICGIEGEAEYWNNIILTCKSEEASPEPVYQWKSYSVDNIPRPFPPKTTEKDGALSLFNISRETSGYFRCTSTNRIGSASCNFTLAVMPPSSNMGATIGIIAGVVAGLLCLGITIYCCCKKKGKKDKNPESSPTQVAYYDKDAPESGVKYVDEDKRKVQDEDDVSFKKSQEESPDRRDNKNDHYNSHNSRSEDRPKERGSRDRLDDNRERYGGSRDRLDDNRERYGGSRDRLDDNRERYGGSRDRLDDNRERYGGSRDRLDDNRERYGGSRDRLDDNHGRYGGSRDRLDDQRDQRRGSRDRLGDRYEQYDER
ncbi:uncharacterized protein ACB058_008901 [Synchiropus picturatus]